MEGGSWRRAGRQLSAVRGRGRGREPPPAAAQGLGRRGRRGLGRLRDVHDQLDAAAGGAADRRFVARWVAFRHSPPRAGGRRTRRRAPARAARWWRGCWTAPSSRRTGGSGSAPYRCGPRQRPGTRSVQDRRQPLDHVQSGGAERGLARGEQQLVADAKAHRLLVDDHVHRFAQVGQSQRFLGRAFSGGAASATISPSLAVAGAAAWAVAPGAAHSGGMATLSNSEYSPS